MTKQNLAIDLQQAKEYRIVRFGIPESGLYALALSGRSVSPAFVVDRALDTFKTLGKDDLDPAHTPVYLDRVGGRHFFEIMVEAGKAEALKNHASRPLVCRPEELEDIISGKPPAKYREVMFRHADRVVQEQGESVHDAITRTALAKFPGLSARDFSPTQQAITGNGGHFILFVEEKKAEALEKSGHKDIILPDRPKKPAGPRLG